MDLGNLGPREMQQYPQGADFPLNKDDAIKVAQDNDAPDQVVDQMRDRLPEGELSSLSDVTSSLGL